MEHRELFGDEAARDTLLALSGAPPAEIVDGLRAAVVGHAEGRPADDLCLIPVRLDLDVDQAVQPQAA